MIYFDQEAIFPESNANLQKHAKLLWNTGLNNKQVWISTTLHIFLA